MQSRAGHKNSRIMRYWIKEYQVEFVHLLNSSCHQDSQSIDTRIHKSFLQDSFLFWFWQLYSHLENKHQQLLCILCETLQGDLFSSCHDSTSFLGTFFFPVGAGIISPVQTSLSPYHILHSGGLLELVFLPLNSVGLGTKLCFSSSSPP